MWQVWMPNSKWHGAMYIGQSIDLLKREKQHLNNLIKDEHFNKKLQYFINKYGVGVLQFSILLECTEKELNFWEKWYIKSFDTYKSKLGFNMTPGGHSISDTCKRPCRFVNMVTRESIQAESLSSFARNHNLTLGSVSALYLNKIKRLFNWYCPEISGWQPRYYYIISPDEKQYELVEYKVGDFAYSHGIIDKNEIAAFSNMVYGRSNHYKGWRRIDSIKKDRYFINKKYHLIHRSGIIVQGENVSEFARNNKLDVGTILDVVNGEAKEHNGWRLFVDGKSEFPPDAIICKLIDEKDKVYEVTNFTNFGKQYNIHGDNVYHLKIGKLKSYKGFRLYKEDGSHNKIGKKIISPNKEIFHVTDIAKFSKEHNLSAGCLYHILKDVNNQHKGWELYKEREEYAS